MSRRTREEAKTMELPTLSALLEEASHLDEEALLKFWNESDSATRKAILKAAVK